MSAPSSTQKKRSKPSLEKSVIKHRENQFKILSTYLAAILYELQKLNKSLEEVTKEDEDYRLDS